MQLERSTINLITIYGAVLLLSAILQTTVLSGIVVFGVVPTLYMAATISIAMYEGVGAGALFGLVLGYLVDATAGMNVGLSALTFMVVGMIAGLAAERYMLRNFIAALVLYALLHVGIIACDLFIRLLVSTGLTGFLQDTADRLIAAALSAIYLVPYYLLAKRLRVSLGGREDK